jgi:hypothetical protein
MSTQMNEPQTLPEQYRDTLLEALGARQTDLDQFDSYYRGEHRLLFATAKFRETFGTLFSTFADNWCDLVVDASAERLKVEGFRFGSKDADADAWAIWQANDLDAEADLAHTESVKLGCSYALVGPDDGGDPSIQIEPRTKAIVALDPAQGRTRIAGLRDWVDEWGTEHCVLYLPDAITWWRRDAGAEKSWELDDLSSGGNPLGVVPLVPLPNMPTLCDRQGRSDIERVIPLQDAINKLCADMIVASEYAAYPQRWVTGVEIPKYPDGHPNAGQPLPSMVQFLSGADRVMAVEDAQASFGNFAVSDLGIYTKAIEAFIQHVAAQTRTPPHYLLGAMGSFPSGESLKATETGLVAKVRRKQLALGEGWEETIRLAFKVAGDEQKAEATDCETIWRNPESRSIAEIADAAMKYASIGIPRPAIWEFVGATPQQIERWIAEGAPTEGPPVAARETITPSPGEVTAELGTAVAGTTPPKTATETITPTTPGGSSK